MSQSSIQRRQLKEKAAALREQGWTWVEIANVLRRQHDLNARAAMRHAHGWSQADVARRWSERWPADIKSDKAISYWEQWPGDTGYAPSLETLGKLALIFECSTADLLVDVDDFRPSDKNYQLDSSDEADPVSKFLNLDLASLPHIPEQWASVVEGIAKADVGALAQTASELLHRLESESEARRLLLRLSAALRMAADRDLDEFEAAAATLEPWSPDTRSSHDVSGIWESNYTYQSSSRPDEEISSRHYVVLRQHRDRVSGASLPHTKNSNLRFQLLIDNSIATGVWMEHTSPTEHYRGATYHGAIQLVVDPRGREMRGKWVGFSREYTVNTGQWELDWLESSTSKQSQRKYHLKA